MKTIATLNLKPLRSTICTLLLCVVALWAMPTSASAQLYVSAYSSGIVGEYNATTGNVINANLITGLNQPTGLALSGNHLFVATAGDGTVGEYNATNGHAINANFITGLSNPQVLVLLGNKLFVTNHDAGTVGEYNATNGATINANFVGGLRGPQGLALSDNNLFVAENFGTGTVGEYNATNGNVINADLITGLSFPQGLTLSGNHLFVTEQGTGTVGEYNATNGATIKATIVGGLDNPETVAIASAPQPCTLGDTVSYNASTGTLTMKFTVSNQETAPVTWNAWLTYQDTMESLFSVSQPITTSPQTITKTRNNLSPEGEVGVLSTLITPAQGILCSSWVQTNTH